MMTGMKESILMISLKLFLSWTDMERYMWMASDAV